MPDNGDSTEAELMVELLTDPDVAELADDVLEWFDNDEDILDRVENIVADYWPGSDLFATSEEGLNFLAECEEQVRTAIEFVLMAKIKEKVVADVTVKLSLREANVTKDAIKIAVTHLKQQMQDTDAATDPNWKEKGQDLLALEGALRRFE